MWIWLIPVALAITGLASCAHETPIADDFENDLSDDVSLYYMSDGRKPNMEDLNDLYNPQRDIYDIVDLDESDEFVHPVRTYKRGGFVRYGRNNDKKIHVRYGRDTKHIQEQAVGNNPNSNRNGPHIRIGPTDSLERRKRSTYEESGDQHEMQHEPKMDRVGTSSTHRRYGRNGYNDDEAVQEYSLTHPVPPALLPLLKHFAARISYENQESRNKRQSTHSRLGRTDPLERSKRSTYHESAEHGKHQKTNMDRVGRAGSYMRFGRNYYNDDDSAQELSLNQEHPIPPVLLPLLKQLAARMNYENGYSGCARFKRQSKHVRQGRTDPLERSKRSTSDKTVEV